MRNTTNAKKHEHLLRSAWRPDSYNHTHKRARRRISYDRSYQLPVNYQSNVEIFPVFRPDPPCPLFPNAKCPPLYFISFSQQRLLSHFSFFSVSRTSHLTIGLVRGTRNHLRKCCRLIQSRPPLLTVETPCQNRLQRRWDGIRAQRKELLFPAVVGVRPPFDSAAVAVADGSERVRDEEERARLPSLEFQQEPCATCA